MRVRHGTSAALGLRHSTSAERTMVSEDARSCLSRDRGPARRGEYVERTMEEDGLRFSNVRMSMQQTSSFHSFRPLQV